MSKDHHSPSPTNINWADASRHSLFNVWLQQQAQLHGVLPESCRLASADASFRRYFRVDRARASSGTAEHRGASGCESLIVMDAPPQNENCKPFVQVAELMRAAGLQVPEILSWDETQGFMLLSDLGHKTLLQFMQERDSLTNFAPNLNLYRQAIEELVKWQAASQADVLPNYDEALLRRELQLFPDWYIAQHKGLSLNPAQTQVLSQAFDRIVARNLNAPMVFVHRDFMPRNLMVMTTAADQSSTQSLSLGILDFQDAVYGPITYDIASLMRDAFLSWPEDAVLDVTVRYWQQARKAGLIKDGPWGEWANDFGSFYSAVEWMGLQRHLKILGIFARLTLRDGKAAYLADTPRFIAYVRHTASRYIELKPLLNLIDEIEGIESPSAFAFGRVN
jgi:N-acetylmuramate 1-kinase